MDTHKIQDAITKVVRLVEIVDIFLKKAKKIAPAAHKTPFASLADEKKPLASLADEKNPVASLADPPPRTHIPVGVLEAVPDPCT